MNLADLDPHTLRVMADELTERIERCIESRENCFAEASRLGKMNVPLVAASWRRSAWKADGSFNSLKHFRTYLRSTATRIETKRRKGAA